MRRPPRAPDRIGPLIVVVATFTFVATTRASQDPAAALAACKAGSGADCVRAGHLYNYGVGIPKDVTQATALYEKACALGEASGCLHLVLLHDTAAGADAARIRAHFQESCAPRPLVCGV